MLISIEWSEKAPLKRFHLRSSVTGKEETSHANIGAKGHFRWTEEEDPEAEIILVVKKTEKGSVWLEPSCSLQTQRAALG